MHFDLENQFFHVQLDPEAKKYFRFALQITRGEKECFCFHIMVYGFESSVALVTRLIKLLQGLLHEAGIRTSIYVDDGQVLGSIKDETRQDMEVAVTAFQLDGWNIQRNVHLKSLAHRVAARFLMADMERAMAAVESQEMSPPREYHPGPAEAGGSQHHSRHKVVEARVKTAGRDAT
jgi:hypothetical protein